ncbi:MAG: ATP-binding protein, partial [Myxococcota bacterium]|nr:ATP-binding protein [Myxococcota bacterium]
FEFTKQADRLRTSMTTVIDVRALAKLIMEHLERSRRVTHASMYLREEEGLTYRREGHVGTPPPEVLDVIQARPFLDHLLESQILAIENLTIERDEILKRGAIEDQARVEVIESVITNMEACQSSLSIGFISEGQLLGMMNVRDERLREAYATDEVKALVAIAAQATITIENSRLFDRIRERDRLAALGEMAAGLAHEIRNPLGAIKGAAQLLDEDTADGEAYLQVITEEVNRLNGVVSQFLTYARPFKGTREGIDLNGVLERSLTLVNAEEHNCEVTLDTATDLPSIRSDAELLRQVTLNLARNAIEAMGETGGHLRISTSQIQRRTVNPMGKSRRVEFVRIRFEDEGPGIPTEVLERIFIPFYTTKTGGTGLGLSICQRIIRSLGGSIEVTARLGEGSTFTILLPVETEPRTRPPTSPAPPAGE